MSLPGLLRAVRIAVPPLKVRDPFLAFGPTITRWTSRSGGGRKIAASAAVSIWSGWVGLGGLCGFGDVEPLPGIVPRRRRRTQVCLDDPR
jgi:hypothetical protein